MVKKQPLAVGGLASAFSSRRSINKQQDTASAPPAATSTGEVLPWHPFSFACSAWQWQWQWRWTSCSMRPRTLSFRQQQSGEQEEEDDAKKGDVHHRQLQKHQEEAAYDKTMNSVCSVDFSGDDSFASVDSFTSSTASEEAESSDAEAVIVQALRSDRLLYEPADDIEDDGDSCCRLIKPSSSPSKSKQSISINKQKQAAVVADNDDGDDKPKQDTSSIVLSSNSKAPALAMFGGATAMSLDSHNPYRDFRESMEAMVMSQLGQEGGVKDWRWLEEMLGWYLRANGKATHGLIVAAFVDLLVAAADFNYSSSSSSSSPVATPPASATNCSAASSIVDCSCCSSSSL